jgi:predicted RNA-binding protein YlqC (UPF0109 family)
VIGELVGFLVKGVVRRPEEVSVAESATAGRVAVSIGVAPDDYGRVIGRSGQVIHAIRALAEFAGERAGKEVLVDVVEPGRARGGQHGEPR